MLVDGVELDGDNGQALGDTTATTSVSGGCNRAKADRQPVSRELSQSDLTDVGADRTRFPYGLVVVLEGIDALQSDRFGITFGALRLILNER